jgi:hypothetical protein
MSCNSTSNRVAGAACAAGVSRLISKYGFYAGVAAAGLGAALLAAKLSKPWRADWTARREIAAARRREEDEINRLLAEPEPTGEHPRYHLFDEPSGDYLGWTHSRPAAEKMAAMRGWKTMPASSTLTEEEVIRAYSATLNAKAKVNS